MTTFSLREADPVCLVSFTCPPAGSEHHAANSSESNAVITIPALRLLLSPYVALHHRCPLLCFRYVCVLGTWEPVVQLLH